MAAFRSVLAEKTGKIVRADVKPRQRERCQAPTCIPPRRSAYKVFLRALPYVCHIAEKSRRNAIKPLISNEFVLERRSQRGAG
jgi:hypothetical protein